MNWQFLEDYFSPACLEFWFKKYVGPDFLKFTQVDRPSKNGENSTYKYMFQWGFPD